jgi:hypothetical protein
MKRNLDIRGCICTIVTAGVVVTALLSLSGCGAPTASYTPIVAAITSGALPIPANGVIGLPAKWRGIVPRDVVHAEKRPDGRIFILFPTFHGRGEDVDGWLYCSAPITPADFYTIDWGPGGKHSQLDVAGCKMLSVESHRPPWYWVTRRLD